MQTTIETTIATTNPGTNRGEFHITGPVLADEPMYSYNQPANDFWQGFYAGLREKGLSHEEAIAELQSKGT